MGEMKKFGIPNILSCIRILMIPLFVWRYLTAASEGAYVLAAGILVLSGLTDMLDGYIARKYKMITPVGRLLDPLADKLTQAAVCIVLTIRMPNLFFILIVFVVKEVVMLLAGYKLYKTVQLEDIPGSKWFGKLYTLFFYGVMIVIIGSPRLSVEAVAWILIVLGIFMIFAFVMYIPEFYKVRKKRKAAGVKK